MQAANTTDVRRALGSTFLFATLSEEQLGSLAAQVWLERLPSGSVIVREGDEAESLYVVVEGGVNVLKGDGQFLAFLGPGGFFGEMALFMDQSRRSATCQATVDTTCVVVRKHVLEQFCDARPDAGLVIYRAIIRTLAERLQNTSADLAYLMSAQVRQQSAVSSIVEKAKKRGPGSRGGPQP
jgi:CRP-like cAMP-binding protein